MNTKRHNPFHELRFLAALLTVSLVLYGCDTTGDAPEETQQTAAPQNTSSADVTPNRIPEPGKCVSCPVGGEVCTDVDGNGVIDGGDCPEGGGGGGGGGDGDDGTCDGPDDFCCAARSSGELGVSIAGPCETWRGSGHTYSGTSGSNPNDYHFRWFIEWDLGHRMSDPMLLAEGTGVDEVNTDNFYIPGTRFRITVQAREKSTDETGLAFMDVETVRNPNTGKMLTAGCGWEENSNMFPFAEDVGDIDQDPAREHKCYVRGCGGQRKYLKGMSGDTLKTDESCPTQF